jgi:hypothetical protein
VCINIRANPINLYNKDKIKEKDWQKEQEWPGHREAALG